MRTLAYLCALILVVTMAAMFKSHPDHETHEKCKVTVKESYWERRTRELKAKHANQFADAKTRGLEIERRMGYDKATHVCNDSGVFSYSCKECARRYHAVQACRTALINAAMPYGFQYTLPVEQRGNHNPVHAPCKHADPWGKPNPNVDPDCAQCRRKCFD